MRGCVIALLFAVVGFGQEASHRTAKFEVAAITVAQGPGNPALDRAKNDDRVFTTSGTSLKLIIGRAYGMGTFQIVRTGFEWVNSTYFDIRARIPDGVTRDKIPEMLQNLLQERFGLVARRENRIVKGYILSLTNAELLRTKGANPDVLRLPSEDRELRFVAFTRNPMDGLVRGLGELLGGIPVLNETKMEGTYTLFVQIPQGYAGDMSGEMLDSFAGYGLKLQKGEFPFDYLVLEKINKTPTEN